MQSFFNATIPTINLNGLFHCIITLIYCLSISFFVYSIVNALRFMSILIVQVIEKKIEIRGRFALPMS